MHVQRVSSKKKKKRTAINDFVPEHDVDVYCLTESWLRSQDDEANRKDLPQRGYTTLSFPRSLRGGGIAIAMKKSLSPQVSVKPEFPILHSAFELAHLTITLPRHTVSLFCWHCQIRILSKLL